MTRKTGGNLANLTVKRGFGLLSAARLMRDLAPTKSSWIVHETDTRVQQCGRGIRSSLADPDTPHVVISVQGNGGGVTLGTDVRFRFLVWDSFARSVF